MVLGVSFLKMLAEEGGQSYRVRLKEALSAPLLIKHDKDGIVERVTFLQNSQATRLSLLPSEFIVPQTRARMTGLQ